MSSVPRATVRTLKPKKNLKTTPGCTTDTNSSQIGNNRKLIREFNSKKIKSYHTNDDEIALLNISNIALVVLACTA